MLHPLFALLATQPELLAGHAQAYAELLGSDLVVQVRVLQRRSLLCAMALCCAGVAGVLAGVSLLLASTVVAPNQAAPLALWLVPLVPALACGLCLGGLRATNATVTPPFARVRHHLQADAAMLRDLANA